MCPPHDEQAWKRFIEDVLRLIQNADLMAIHNGVYSIRRPSRNPGDPLVEILMNSEEMTMDNLEGQEVEWW